MCVCVCMVLSAEKYEPLSVTTTGFSVPGPAGLAGRLLYYKWHQLSVQCRAGGSLAIRLPASASQQVKQPTVLINASVQLTSKPASQKLYE